VLFGPYADFVAEGVEFFDEEFFVRLEDDGGGGARVGDSMRADALSL
jgi:hypothetical protein